MRKALLTQIILLAVSSFPPLYALEALAVYGHVILSPVKQQDSLNTMFRVTVKMYLINDSKEIIKVATRAPKWSNEMPSLQNMRLHVPDPLTEWGEVYRVSPEDYGIVQLEPGQLTKLETLYYFTEDKAEITQLPDTFRLTYSVGLLVADQLGIWSGELNCERFVNSKNAATLKR
jgi:hypothetical protein